MLIAGKWLETFRPRFYFQSINRIKIGLRCLFPIMGLSISVDKGSKSFDIALLFFHGHGHVIDCLQTMNGYERYNFEPYNISIHFCSSTPFTKNSRNVIDLKEPAPKPSKCFGAIILSYLIQMDFNC